MLKASADHFTEAWTWIGDFNTLADQTDNGKADPLWNPLMVTWGRLCGDQGLVDLGFQGAPFTWSNKCGGKALIRECLDCGISNGDWQLVFPRASIKHCPRFAFDHVALFLDTYGDK